MPLQRSDQLVRHATRLSIDRLHDVARRELPVLRLPDPAQPRLGRGLTSLLGDLPGDAGDGNLQTTVAVAEIAANPYQARRAFDEDEIKHLSESIRTHGVLQPLVVRAVNGSYQLIAGERRLRAAQQAGLAQVPVTVVNFDDKWTAPKPNAAQAQPLGVFAYYRVE